MYSHQVDQEHRFPYRRLSYHRSHLQPADNSHADQVPQDYRLHCQDTNVSCINRPRSSITTNVECMISPRPMRTMSPLTPQVSF
ncbi:hypothetical protein O3M35_008313 [Rhynocoris fuscipes]|uniref:Uncharacterized protein n=1 Tax=Rhynocoris fuscipes TaxID=488301 RepID=A0AAW1D5V4_9HEMI